MGKNDLYIELFHFSGLCDMLFEWFFFEKEQQQQEEGPRPAILLEMPNWNQHQLSP